MCLREKGGREGKGGILFGGVSAHEALKEKDKYIRSPF